MVVNIGGYVQELKALIDRKTGKKISRNPRFVKQDQVVIATLQAAGVICVENFKDFPQMARFTLRDEGEGRIGKCDIKGVGFVAVL